MIGSLIGIVVAGKLSIIQKTYEKLPVLPKPEIKVVEDEQKVEDNEIVEDKVEV